MFTQDSKLIDRLEENDWVGFAVKEDCASMKESLISSSNFSRANFTPIRPPTASKEKDEEAKQIIDRINEKQVQSLAINVPRPPAASTDSIKR